MRSELERGDDTEGFTVSTLPCLNGIGYSNAAFMLDTTHQDAAMDHRQVYHSDPQIMGGTPVFTGTRVPVDSLIIHLKAGDSLERFLDGFPSVSREQAEAFLELALAEALEVTPQEDSA